MVKPWLTMDSRNQFTRHVDRVQVFRSANLFFTFLIYFVRLSLRIIPVQKFWRKSCLLFYYRIFYPKICDNFFSSQYFTEIFILGWFWGSAWQNKLKKVKNKFADRRTWTWFPCFVNWFLESMVDHGLTINHGFWLVFGQTMVFSTIAALWSNHRGSRSFF